MGNKKTWLGAGLLGLAGLTALGYSVQKKVTEKHQAATIKNIRSFFTQEGPIQVLYIKSYESTEDCLAGGVVLEDGRTFDFSYTAGELIYHEVDHD